MRRRYIAPAAAIIIAMVCSHSTARSGDSRQDADLPSPRVVLKKTTLDLGVLDPEDKCGHVFIVKNDGNAPLEITKAGTSCKCTVSVLPAGEIPPGKGGPIEVESKNTATEDGPFSHTATFLTNDPKMPRFDLTIQGVILKHIVAKPPVIHLPELEQGKPVEMTALILSEAWDAFSLKNVVSNIDGLKWDFQPAHPEQLREYKAKSGYVGTFRLPADRIGKGFSGWVDADAHPAGKQERSRSVRVALSGRVVAIRTVFGRVDPDGVVAIGTLSPGQGAKVPLLLQIRGQHKEIQVREIQTTPSCLKVSVAALSPELAKKGLYRIMVEVPQDAPPCNCITEGQLGTLRILTDHPDMPEIAKLKVAFAVSSE